MNTHIVDRSDRYCVVGAGPTGLIAARALRHAGIPYDHVEKHAAVGGLWDLDNEGSPAYETAHFISSKTRSHVPGYPMPDDFPDYPGHARILQYVRSFAKAYALDDAIELDTPVHRAEPDGKSWLVTLGSGEVRRYRGLFLCTGIWHPVQPSYPGSASCETMHSVEYRSPAQLEGKHVLVVGGGNSACDIACDAAQHAASATISMRRGYHFIPKYIFGTPTDVFADGIALPHWLERRSFELILRLLIGDLRKYGLPKPDHSVLAAHPLVNTQVLHHIGHGDLQWKPDVERFDGGSTTFVDGTRQDYDLVVFATGIRVRYPFMDEDLFDWEGPFPDLYLSAFHRTYDNVCCLGLHQSVGAVYEFSTLSADMMCNFILDQDRAPGRAARFLDMKRNDRKRLDGGIRYLPSERHRTHLENRSYRRHCDRIMAKLGWTELGTSQPPVA